ncbi:MAG: ABC transporter permease [Lachnospiraceae bacterium]|nr:ABC transporter permease [Lachnospiraceae bacterium]
MLKRKLFRTALGYKAQFISMIIMIAIGVGVFVGFNMEWVSLEKDVTEFLDDTEYADYRIYNEMGFSKEEIDAISGIEGVDAASRVLSVNVGIKDTKDALSLFVVEDYVVSTMLVQSGEEYSEESDGFWISDKYAAKNNVSVGDEIVLTYRGMEIAGEVKGLVKSGEYLICVVDENQLMPDFDSFGYVYAAPKKIAEAIGMEFYPQINIISKLSKEALENEIRDAINKTTLVVSKDEHMSYAGAMSEVEEGKTMGAILPILFLLIALLTMVTTMHRITANEKTQIGTLKALGFKDRKILTHYTSYGFSIGLIGTLLGILLGFAIAGFVINPNGMMGTYLDMPVWKLYLPWFCWPLAILTVLFLTAIGYLSVKEMLKGTAADALRPYTPKKMKAMAIEKFDFFHKLPFATKWNLRDIWRHKARSFMTLIGVIGCMLLLVGGLGMKDTMGAFFDLIDEEINNYETRVNIVETADNEVVKEFAKENNGDWVASASIKVVDKAVTLEIYDVTHDLIRFIDEDNERVTLGSDGAYICSRLTEDIKVGDTIEFSPYGEEETYTIKVAGVIRSVMTENIVMTKEYAESAGIPYHIGAVFTDLEQDSIADADYISGKQSKKMIMDSYDAFMEIMNIMVALFVVAAVVLGIVVLYNLGVMSYLERSRELSTLKVVGFQDKHIGKILISQNVWLTILGVIIGLPGGVAVLYILIKSLAGEYELSLELGALTYSVSMLVTFGVSLVVGLMVARKNKHIDMVEALKGRD